MVLMRGCAIWIRGLSICISSDPACLCRLWCSSIQHRCTHACMSRACVGVLPRRASSCPTRSQHELSASLHSLAWCAPYLAPYVKKPAVFLRGRCVGTDCTMPNQDTRTSSCVWCCFVRFSTYTCSRNPRLSTIARMWRIADSACAAPL